MTLRAGKFLAVFGALSLEGRTMVERTHMGTFVRSHFILSCFRFSISEVCVELFLLEFFFLFSVLGVTCWKAAVAFCFSSSGLRVTKPRPLS